MRGQLARHGLGLALVLGLTATGAPPKQRGDSRTVAEVVALNVAWRRSQGPAVKGCALATIGHLEDAVDLLPGLMRLRVQQVDEAAVLLAQDKLRETHAASSVNRTLAMVSSAWSWARARKLVPGPWPAPKRLEEPDTDKRPLTPAEVRAILGYLGTPRRRWWLPMFMAFYDSGCRTSELVGADEAQLDRETGWLRVYAPKTRAWRWVLLSRATLDALPAPRGPAWPLFPARHGNGERASRHQVKSIMARACAALGIEDVDVHSWRRTWVTDATQTPGVTHEQAMRLSGHASIEEFRGYQTNAPAAPADLQRVARAILERRQVEESSTGPSTERVGQSTQVLVAMAQAGVAPATPRCGPRAAEVQRGHLRALGRSVEGRPGTSRRRRESSTRLLGSLVQAHGRAFCRLLVDLDEDEDLRAAAVATARAELDAGRKSHQA